MRQAKSITTAAVLSRAAMKKYKKQAKDILLEDQSAKAGDETATAVDERKQNDNGSTYYEPPLPSRTTRNVMKPSRGSSRGFLILKFPSDRSPRKYFYESILEKCFLILMYLNATVSLIQEQPPFISYVDDAGRSKTHTFDFLVVFKDGGRIAAAIKPAFRVEQLNFERELELIAAAMPKTFADQVLLVTDEDIDKATANQVAREFMMSNRSLMGDAS